MKMTAIQRNFYRRVLPKLCIDFASERGKQLFKDALMTGYMNCYFPLASQFRTQEEPAYCGLSSLVMVLNALAIDPGQVWKGVFRWYHEDMLDCCTPLEEIKQKGVTMDNLLCLAMCNQLKGEITRVRESSCMSKFREHVKQVTSNADQAIIVSYGRSVLGQTGTGHFSPIGGYNEKEDMVLILDVARFKYPPYWLNMTDLWRAMMSLDTETGLPRGFMTLWRADDKSALNQPPLLFQISKSMNAFKPMLQEVELFLSQARKFLRQSAKQRDSREILKTIIFTLMRESAEAEDSEVPTTPKFLSLRLNQSELEELCPDESAELIQLIQAIKNTNLYKKVIEIIPENACCRQSLFGISSKSEGSCCSEAKISLDDRECTICFPHFLTVFLLSFPVVHLECCFQKATGLDQEGQVIEGKDKGTYLSFIDGVATADLETNCEGCQGPEAKGGLGRRLLINEVTQLRRQFVALLSRQERE